MKSIGNEFFQVGHTHNGVDQRLSVMGPCLKHASTLETPTEFKELLAEKYRPSKGRSLHFEILSGTWDYGEYFSHLGVNISGLVSTAAEATTNHAWRICRRADLENYSHGNNEEAWRVDVAFEDWCTWSNIGMR